MTDDAGLVDPVESESGDASLTPGMWQTYDINLYEAIGEIERALDAHDADLREPNPDDGSHEARLREIRTELKDLRADVPDEYQVAEK